MSLCAFWGGPVFKIKSEETAAPFGGSPKGQMGPGESQVPFSSAMRMAGSFAVVSLRRDEP